MHSCLTAIHSDCQECSKWLDVYLLCSFYQVWTDVTCADLRQQSVPHCMAGSTDIQVCTPEVPTHWTTLRLQIPLCSVANIKTVFCYCRSSTVCLFIYISEKMKFLEIQVQKWCTQAYAAILPALQAPSRCMSMHRILKILSFKKQQLHVPLERSSEVLIVG